MKQGQFPAVLPLSSLNGQNGFKIDGENNGDAVAIPSAPLGTSMGMGMPDLIIGAIYYSSRE